MADWEDEDIDTPATIQVPIVRPGMWDGEDAEEVDVKDSWDAEEEEEKPKEKPIVVPKPKQKKKLSQRLQRGNKRRRRIPLRTKTLEERKQREERSIRESDFENAKELFGVSDTPATSKSSFIDTMRPTSKPEFDEFTSLLTQKLSAHEKNTNFSYFVESLTRDLCVSLSVDDVKRISSSLTALANEKLKAAKPAAGKKKAPAKKAVLKTGPSGGADITNYDDGESKCVYI
ncbi:eukaryotic translation initiation factor 3 subunit J [Chytridium lagenaria]|nr:eukaryotic translation initiation factor 3 subunit J [Chytridium lagenaria]